MFPLRVLYFPNTEDLDAIDNSLVLKFPVFTDVSFQKLLETLSLNREHISGDTVYILILDHFFETDLNRLKVWIPIW
jgi:hypothetical protein